MRPLLVWQDSWWLNIQPLDQDHRLMVQLINELAIADGDDGAARLCCLDALIAHLRGHFGREEAFLQDIAYPELLSHRHEHAVQLAEFVLLRRELQADSQRDLGLRALQSIKGGS